MEILMRNSQIIAISDNFLTIIVPSNSIAQIKCRKPSCIGKRFAELQMELLIANVIRNFKLEWNYPDMKIKRLLANFPDSELKIKITEVCNL
ncbi:hypothetical protein PVAND_015191 [Polypedilum vanderplanki]|uniref:Uncharacterized protein n=1 Tax=Polypedilum vanderplanki TaxID=319348 RepID=A0A9J6BCC2_POLVA|nr:hypothetical protein PVAND_015191 [Polypedilum vanderplanki]